MSEQTKILYCPECAAQVEVETPEDETKIPTGADHPDKCPACGQNVKRLDPIPPAYNDVYGQLDSTGGLLDHLANALHAADLAGFHVESDEDRRADIDAYLDQAWDEIDGDDPEAEAVEEFARKAAQAASEFHRGLDEEVAEFTLPEHIDSGVYDTLGEFTEYIRNHLITLNHYAEMWVEQEA
jgi:endogenous inhibitor of DNA gyrase (YacG/DUF329 family)